MPSSLNPNSSSSDIIWFVCGIVVSSGCSVAGALVAGLCWSSGYSLLGYWFGWCSWCVLWLCDCCLCDCFGFTVLKPSATASPRSWVCLLVVSSVFLYCSCVVGSRSVSALNGLFSSLYSSSSSSSSSIASCVLLVIVVDCLRLFLFRRMPLWLLLGLSWLLFVLARFLGWCLFACFFQVLDVLFPSCIVFGSVVFVSSVNDHVLVVIAVA